MPASIVELNQLPTCDCCQKSYLGNLNEVFRRVSIQDLVMCEKCFESSCSQCGEEIKEIGVSANGKAYCGDSCLFDDAKACNEAIWHC